MAKHQRSSILHPLKNQQSCNRQSSIKKLRFGASFRGLAQSRTPNFKLAKNLTFFALIFLSILKTWHGFRKEHNQKGLTFDWLIVFMVML